MSPMALHTCTTGPADHSSQRRQMQDFPPPAALCCCKPLTYPLKQRAWVCCHNPWPNEDVYFCPEEGLPTFVSGVPALTSGSKVWVAIHNNRPEPLRLHTGQTVGTLEVVAVAGSPPPPAASSPQHPPPFPTRLSPNQQQQLKALFQEFSDIISQGVTTFVLIRNSSGWCQWIIGMM